MVILLILFTTAARPVLRLTTTVPAHVVKTNVAKPSEIGVASYYADNFQGKRTASGEIFDMNKLTAAHRRLPYGTKVKVTRLDSGRSVIVKVNDRGPHVDRRVIDLSLAAARELDMLDVGITRVSVEPVK